MQYDEVSKVPFRKDNYIIADTVIYEIKRNDNLAKGYPWRNDKDTIWYDVKDSLYIDLGRNAFLRQIDTNMFALNIRSHLIVEGVKQLDAGWWFVNQPQTRRSARPPLCSESRPTGGLQPYAMRRTPHP
mgnify:CR=1 FL=1